MPAQRTGATAILNYSELIERLDSTVHPSEALIRGVAARVTSERTQEKRPGLIEHWVRRWQTYRAPAVAAEYQSWYDRDGVLDRLDEIRVPTLCVHGEKDVFEIERAAETADGLPNGLLAAISGAGHLSNLERPAAVNSALGEFLATVYEN